MPFDPELSFILSPNNKGGNPKRPDYRGSVQVAGVTYEMAGWIRKKHSDGSEFLSGVLKVKQDRPKAAEPEAKTEEDAPFQPVKEAPKAASRDELDEDVPF